MMWTTRQRSEIGPLSAITAGKGPRVLLLHGVGLRAEAWGPQIDAMAGAGFRVIAPDMLGHGHSAAAPDGAVLSDFAAPLVTLLNQPIVIVGHSMGAMLAVELAAACPENVRGVVAMNAIFQRSQTAKTSVQARADALDGATVPDPTPTLDRWFAGDASPARAACQSWLTTVSPAGYRAAYTVFANCDGPSENCLRHLNCPALFITGADEPNSTPAMSEKMAKLAPNGRAEIFANAAHMLPMTHSDTVNAQLVRFAKECLT